MVLTQTTLTGSSKLFAVYFERSRRLFNISGTTQKICASFIALNFLSSARGAQSKVCAIGRQVSADHRQYRCRYARHRVSHLAGLALGTAAFEQFGLGEPPPVTQVSSPAVPATQPTSTAVPALPRLTATAVPASPPPVPASIPVAVTVAISLTVCPCTVPTVVTATPAPSATATSRPVAKAVPAPYIASTPVPYCQPRSYTERRPDGSVWFVTQKIDCSFSGYPVEAPAPTPAEPQPTAPAPQELPAYGQPPQPQVGHPSLYVETGVGQTRKWTIPIDPDKVLIVGGFTVNGRGNGVYTAYSGGQTVTVTVTDGFAAIVKADWAAAEFCFRVGQARQYGWGHSTLEPLPGWPAC